MIYINVSLACNLNKKIWYKKFKVERGITSIELLRRAQDFLDCPLKNIEDLSLGIFAKRVEKSYILEDGDRLEVYSPLILTPAEARRLRVQIQITKNNKLSNKKPIKSRKDS